MGLTETRKKKARKKTKTKIYLYIPSAVNITKFLTQKEIKRAKYINQNMQLN